MKKSIVWLMVLLAGMMLCAAASADWLCSAVFQDGTECDWLNADGCEQCWWCGAKEPVHGLKVQMSGTNFLRLTWYGVINTNANFYYAPSERGSGQ